MSNNRLYNAAFYSDAVQGSLSAAQVVLPLLFDNWRPRSLVDIGCGLGAWCATASELGVANCFGFDGSYVDPERLLIPRAAFKAHDLEVTLPLHIEADMAICVEVAEHLSAGRAEGLVVDLCRIAPLVLFSGAVPFQGGSGHVNENWPEYWAALFAKSGFLPFDCIRDRIWGDARMPWWYRQNLLVFAQPHMARIVPALGAPVEASALSRIHPELFVFSVHRRRLEAARPLGEDIGYYRQAAAGDGYPIGYGTEFNIVFE